MGPGLPPHVGVHHPSLPRPMPPLPHNGANGSPMQRPGMQGLHHHHHQNGSAIQTGGGMTTAGGTTITSSSAVNGVTLLNGQAPFESDPDSEKWWWVCCLEFCFCLL